MSSWYRQSRDEFREFIEAVGCPWECGKCGATDKPLSLCWDTTTDAEGKVSNPPPLSEMAKVLSFIEPDQQKSLIGDRLLCVKCRHSRERLAKRLATAGIEQGPTVVDVARMGGYQIAPPAPTREGR